MKDLLTVLSDNALGIFLGIMAFFLGIVSELMAGAITSSVSSGHITITNERTNWVVRVIMLAKNMFQKTLERWFSNKNAHLVGTFFLYRLEQMEDDRYFWGYSELNLSVNLHNEIKGRFYEYKFEGDATTGLIEGNFVLDQMLVLFLFGHNNPDKNGATEMITAPKFHKLPPVNMGWMVAMNEAEKKPLPVLISREMYNFPKQLLKHEGIRSYNETFSGTIEWNSFKNEIE